MRKQSRAARRSKIPFWFADQIPGYLQSETESGVRKRVRRGDLAKAFNVNIRTVDGWAKRGVIPAPHYLETI